MLRFYAVAALIVLAIGSVIFAHRLGPPDLKISAQATGTPTVEAPERGAVPLPAATFTGEGPWVFSALPACFDEQSRVRGPIALLRGKIPPAHDRIAAGTVIRRADCTVTIRAHDILVVRGTDRLHVPAEAGLYRVDAGLTLVARSGKQLEIRRY